MIKPTRVGIAGVAAVVAVSAIPLTVTGTSSAASGPGSWCGPHAASIALADGFGNNTWREITRYAGALTALSCPRVTKFVYTNGEGNTQKAISDINGLVSQGINAIVDFPDAGEAMLPTLTKAYHAGVIVVPYRVSPGGKAGVNYTAYIGTNFVSAGVAWGRFVAQQLGKAGGNIAFLSGPPGNSQGLQELQGMKSVLKSYPNIKLVGTSPFNVTNWDPATTVTVIDGLLAKYTGKNAIKAIVSDYGSALAGAFPEWAKAGQKIPVVATEDGNNVACAWKADVKSDPGFKLMTVSSQNWMVDYAVRYAVAKATGGVLPTTNVPQQNYENSVNPTGGEIAPNCQPKLPATAINSSGLTNAQQLAALAGKVPTRGK
jgi:ribose transport system substrate-binding protein